VAQHPDVVIVGGAAIGSSTACHLAADPGFSGKVTVIEKDPTYRFSASALSAASIRQQFSSAVNIRISLHGIRFLRDIGEILAVGDHRPGVDLHEGGYLYLASEAGRAVLAANHALQRAEGADILFLEREELVRRHPWLSPEGIACASFGQTGEGWFDGWALLQAFRAKARSLGVEYVQGEAAGYETERGRIVAVCLGDGARIPCGVAVNAAGSDGARLAATAGVAIPVKSMTRHVFTFTCKAELPSFPMLIDASGVYVRPEGKRGADGQMFICGASPPPERDREWHDTDPSSQDVDWGFFEDVIWPTLAERVPAFEAIRPGRAWSGPYDMNSLDGNAILGPAIGMPNLLLANGFSGHGLQQSPAVGRGLAEQIIHGRHLTLDLSDLGHERIVAGRAMTEANII
jgi:glycine/D-amino acid oxidase-like deaminating enzyme